MEDRARRWRGCSATSTSPTARRSTAIRAACSSASSRAPPTWLHVLRRARARVLLLQALDDPQFLDQGGYFDETPLDVATDYRKRTVQYLESMGIPVEYVHHEVAPSPARDRPPLHRRAHDGRQRDDLPPDREGGRAGVRHLRDLHAEAGRRRERQRHAHAPVAVRGRPQRVLRRAPTSTTCRRRRSATSPGSCGTRPRSRSSRTSG